jgi:glycosyltransferase involved in cell wall biosynthesis
MAKQGNIDAPPLFTIIIPTKNRGKFLHHTLRTCMMQNYDRLEVIVSDDGSTDNTREVVEDASRIDSRIRYISHGSGIGMRDNFEFVLRQVNPGFVIALGGDDGLLPDGIKGMCDILRDTGMDLLAWPAPVYAYPNVRGLNGQLSIYRRRSSIKIIDSGQFLYRQAKNLHYLSDVESPMFYVKGVASTRLIDRVRNRSSVGRFYSCPTPDGYSGIVLAGEVSRYAFSGKPFSIFGLSPESQGLAYLSNVVNAEKASEIFFQNVSSRPMHRELASQPYSPLITLMTVDYLLTARDLPGWPGKFPPIDYRQVLINGINELAHGLYGEGRISRELRILNQIAEMHELGEYYREKVRRCYRKRKRLPFVGSGINSNAIFLDGYSYNLHNIVDAAHAAQYIFQFYSDLQVSNLVRIIANSIKYRWRAIGRGSRFPPESAWRENNEGEEKKPKESSNV